MSDAPALHIGENSPEEVAYKLTRAIATAGGINILTAKATSRAWILKTYAQCLVTIKAPHQVGDHLANPSMKLPL